MKSDTPDYRIIVVDNGSDEETVVHLKEWGSTRRPNNGAQGFREHHVLSVVESQIDDSDLHILHTGTNMGFAGGVNAGLDFATRNYPDYPALCLNSDITVNRDFIRKLLGLCSRLGGNIALLGFPSYNYFKPSQLEATYVIETPYGVPTKFGHPLVNGKDELISCTSILGTAILFTRSGLRFRLDENYFLYLEESDLCQRVIRSGYEIAVASHLPVFHKLSTSVGQDSPTQIYYSWRNSLYYMAKYRTKWQFCIFLLLHTGRVVSRMIVYMKTRDILRYKAISQSYIHFFARRLGPR